MIIDLEKVLFIGAREDLDTFFMRAQQKGCIQFLSSKKKGEYPEEIQTLAKAIKILKKQLEVLPQKDEGEKEALSIAEHVIELEISMERLEEESRLTQAETARILPFGNFSLAKIKELEEASEYHFQFFCHKVGKNSEPVPDELIHVATEYDMNYYISFSKKRISYPKLIEMHFEHSLKELKHKEVEINERIRKAHREIISLTPHLEMLRSKLIFKLNKSALKNAKQESEDHLDNHLFSIEAYIPKNRFKKVSAILEGLAIHFEPISAEEDEKIPTYIENKGLNRVGEDLVHIYDTPATSDRDPSGWVFWAFLLFFSLIISDGGYGFLYLALGLILKFKFRTLHGAMKRFTTLIVALGIGCSVWGIFAGSYFGISIEPNSPLSQVSIIHKLTVEKAAYHMAKQDDVYKEWVEQIPALKQVTTPQEFLEKGKTLKEGRMIYAVVEEFSNNLFLEISLLIGIFHLTFSLLRYLRRDFANLGWIAFMFGGYLYFPWILKATTIIHFLGLISKEASTHIGLQMIIFGIGFSVLVALIQHRLKGLVELTKLIQIFSDVLSYLRIYALGLAGMIMASTFNNIGGLAGFFFGALVVIAGHCVNITLGVMGGVIHGLRLNFLEWYHYSFSGGGKLFNPLRLLKRSSL